MSRTIKFVSLMGLTLLLALSACGSPALTATPAVEETNVSVATEAPTATEAPAAKVPANPNIILATTTFTQDSGLLDVLVPIFQEQTGYTVQTVAVGSGEAMKMGEEGNADVLLVHAPSSEVTFMDNGFGKDRMLVMHNDFIIVGPADDPAKIKGPGAAGRQAVRAACGRTAGRPRRQAIRRSA